MKKKSKYAGWNRADNNQQDKFYINILSGLGKRHFFFKVRTCTLQQELCNLLLKKLNLFPPTATLGAK